MANLRAMEPESKKTLRENVRALIAHRLGLPLAGVGVSHVMRQLDLANGSAQRVLGDSDLRMETVDHIAKALRIESWQLLIPGLDPAALPQIAGSTSPWPFEMVQESRYRGLSAKSRAFVQGKLDNAIEQAEAQETALKTAA